MANRYVSYPPVMPGMGAKKGIAYLAIPNPTMKSRPLNSFRPRMHLFPGRNRRYFLVSVRPTITHPLSTVFEQTVYLSLNSSAASAGASVASFAATEGR